MKTVTITDVAKYANVSKSTVSQYLNQRYEYMGEKTKTRIETAIDELGYRPNIVARSLKQKSTMTIGVIVANILHVFSTQVIRAIEDWCHEADFHVIVCNADDNPAKEKRYIEMLRAKQVDGIIAFPTGGNLDLYKGLVEDNYPIVFVDRIVPGVPISTVLLDNEKASGIAVNEFVEKGYKKIAMITPPVAQNVIPRAERIEGYKNSLESHQLPFNPEYLKSVEISEIKHTMKKMLNLSEPPEAILAMNDRVLFEILKYISENQIKVPEELAVIGIDDVSFASFYNPALTTIAQPAFDMGKRAAELLLEKVHNKDQLSDFEILRFEPHLQARNSC